MDTYRLCLEKARQANQDHDHLEAAYWLCEAMVSRIEYFYGPVPISLNGFKQYVSDVARGA